MNRRRERRKQNEIVTQAWWTVAFELQSHKRGGKRKMPDLRKFIVSDDAPPPPPQQQTSTARTNGMNAKQLKSMMYVLAAQYGGTVRSNGEVVMDIPQRRMGRKQQ